MAVTRKYISIDELRPMVDLASYFSFENDPWMPYRVPSHHLLLIEQGGIRARTPDGQFNASAGDLICFRPAELNEYGTRGLTTYYQTHVEFAPPPRHRLTPWLGDGIGPLPLRVPMGDAMAEMRGLFETLCIELGQVGVSHELRVRAAILEILAVVARVLGGSGAAHHTTAARRRLDVWQRACVRLATPSDARVSDLAAQFGFTTDHFIRQFKRRFGVSPKAYQTQSRMREAARLLRGTDGSIKSIAYALGYADPKAFARSFKQHLGVTPTDLRKSAAASPAAPEPRSPLPERLFKVNQHVLPPHAGPDFLKRWRARVPRL
jgi:AraC-like DNA-binding protein